MEVRFNRMILIAILDVAGATVLMTTDMLLDGVHFSMRDHGSEAVGRKAIACSLSDCAAMAVSPLAATVSVALSSEMGVATAESLVAGMHTLAQAFECDIVGGDTVRWDRPLVIDVCMLATPYPGVEPVRRSGARPGDALVVSGTLGGSLRGRHLTFTPRVCEARQLAEKLGGDLRALMDISDGVSLDLFRMCEASGTGADLFEQALNDVASEDARAAAQVDGRSVLDHVLEDGEDFELLAAVAPEAATEDRLRELGLRRVGVMTERGFVLRDVAGRPKPLEPGGYDHLDGVR